MEWVSNSGGSGATLTTGYTTPSESCIVGDSNSGALIEFYGGGESAGYYAGDNHTSSYSPNDTGMHHFLDSDNGSSSYSASHYYITTGGSISSTCLA